jgi:hypothetical protein
MNASNNFVRLPENKVTVEDLRPDIFGPAINDDSNKVA